ncbi:hypothetical protein GCM10009530_31540 [Microbispora corallina]|uniref:Uncharacterized protein n=1 Tax=Microbispora corallina TaxID=83302 RepID=A0ABQ4G0D2_9ACTN|nr:hypothetical protein Mco01_35160 [Microbispora corallina]
MGRVRGELPLMPERALGDTLGVFHPFHYAVHRRFLVHGEKWTPARSPHCRGTPAPEYQPPWRAFSPKRGKPWGPT